MSDTWFTVFSDPPSAYRPMPVWSWNGVVTRDRITEMLEQFADQGMGGVFVTPRWGLVTEYLSDEWLELFAFAVSECRRLGLQCNIYDEFTCPSGTAGGHVTAGHPELAPAFRSIPAADGAAVETIPAVPRSGCGGFPYADLSRVAATDRFIRLTHERYAAAVGESFGTTVRFAFTDEPELAHHRNGMLWTEHLAAAFAEEHGYRLEPRWREFLAPGVGGNGLRFDYFATLNRLFCTHYAKPLHDWCEANGLLLTGHWMEHTWPDPRRQPSAMALLRWMQAPGNDLLAFQFDPAALDRNLMYVMNVRELASVASQCGRTWSCVESSGAGGHGVAFEVFKPLEDLCLAHGVNLIDPHLSHMTIAGMRKYEWPQTISDHSPWWPLYRVHADHVARTAAALSQGREHNRVLVLQPTATAWMTCRHPETLGKEEPSPLAALRDGFLDLIAELVRDQVDFDLGDETILQEMAAVRDTRLVVGPCSYEMVVVPAQMANIFASTLALLERFLAAGGTVVTAGPEVLTHVNGRPDSRGADLVQRYPERWLATTTNEAAICELRTRLDRRVATPSGDRLPGAPCLRRVVLSDGDILVFLSNPWVEPIETPIRVEGRWMAELDTADGTLDPIETQPHQDGQTTVLTLPPRGHRLWWLRSQPPLRHAVPSAQGAGTKGEAIHLDLRFEGARRLEPNVLVVDYCSVTVNGETTEDIATIHADQLMWQALGFERNPWCLGSTQYRRTIVDHPLPPSSSVQVVYRFRVDADLSDNERAGLVLAVERPWLWAVTVNGRPVAADRGERWLDEAIRASCIGPLVRPGWNTVVLQRAPVHMLCEIAPVYILGTMALRGDDRGFAAGASSPIELGNRTVQGLPFYPGAVRYAFTFQLQAPASRVHVRIPEWAGSAAVVRLDDGPPATVLHPPFATVIDEQLAAGPHRLHVDVVGTLRNLLGQFFNDGLAGWWSWRDGPEHQPPGAAYRVPAVGLLRAPQV